MFQRQDDGEISVFPSGFTCAISGARCYWHTLRLFTSTGYMGVGSLAAWGHWTCNYRLWG